MEHLSKNFFDGTKRTKCLFLSRNFTYSPHTLCHLGALKLLVCS